MHHLNPHLFSLLAKDRLDDLVARADRHRLIMGHRPAGPIRSAGRILAPARSAKRS